MRQMILATMVTLGLAQPAVADNNDLARVLGGIIIGGIIVDALKDPPRVEHHYHVNPPRPRVHVQQPDPNWICYQDVEYAGRWIYTYDRNCWGDVIRFTRHPNPNW